MAAAGSEAAIAATIVQAIKASGAIVQVEPRDFLILLAKCDKPLVVQARGLWPTYRHQYVFGYKGLVFYTKSKDPLQFSMGIELITAKRIWVPT
jgi:hypothetical protein